MGWKWSQVANWCGRESIKPLKFWLMAVQNEIKIQNICPRGAVEAIVLQC